MERQKGFFTINGEKKTYLLFQKGDRVEPKPEKTTSIGTKGTVIETSEGGLFVHVHWDEASYPSALGGTVRLGSRWLINGLNLLEQEQPKQQGMTMGEVQVKVKVAEQELEVQCVCGNQFIVAGEVPHATICDQCKVQIDLRIPRKLLKD